MAMDQRLTEAAESGDIDALYTLIGEDPFVLEYVDRIPFTVTPLHVAVLFGNIRFAMEVLRLKPSFARKPNKDGFTPIHLASTNGNVVMVRKLMDTDDPATKNICLFKGREGRNALHCATVAGKVFVIDEILSTCPEAINELTVGDETVLHLAVKNKQVEAFKVLVKWLKKLGRMELLKRKDEEANTVLHLATYNKQMEVLEMLVNMNNTYPLDINAKNASGLTVIDILQQLPREVNTWDIGVMLRRVQGFTFL